MYDPKRGMTKIQETWTVKYLWGKQRHYERFDNQNEAWQKYQRLAESPEVSLLSCYRRTIYAEKEQLS